VKIAILGGGGAMGGIFGGWLKRAGEDVTLIDVSEPAVTAINANGLSIEEKDGSINLVRVKATTNTSEIGPVDLIINFVKCYHTEAAVNAAKPMLGADTCVLSLQNGWGNAPRIAGIIGEDRVVVGLTYHSGTLLGPGRVKHPGLGITHIGELSNKATPRVSRIAEALRKAGFETTMSSVLREVVDVAKAQGIAIDYDERWSAITGLLEKAIGGKASMLQDVEAGRRTEIEVINGAIIDAGKRHGVATPVNQTLVALISALQAKYLAGKQT
jgi:2-dehydropantoate 2-reductase